MSKFKRYIGDGVYVAFDGYHVTIAVNHHENVVVSLDPDARTAITDYIKELPNLIKDESKNNNNIG